MIITKKMIYIMANILLDELAIPIADKDKEAFIQKTERAFVHALDACYDLSFPSGESLDDWKTEEPEVRT